MRLSRRELECLDALASGETIRQTALRLSVDESTVRTYRQRLYRKLGVANAPQAVVAAFRLREWARSRRPPEHSPRRSCPMTEDNRRCVLCKEGAGSNAERCPTCSALLDAVRTLTEPADPEPLALVVRETGVALVPEEARRRAL